MNKRVVVVVAAILLVGIVVTGCESLFGTYTIIGAWLLYCHFFGNPLTQAYPVVFNRDGTYRTDYDTTGTWMQKGEHVKWTWLHTLYFIGIIAAVGTSMSGDIYDGDAKVGTFTAMKNTAP